MRRLFAHELIPTAARKNRSTHGSARCRPASQSNPSGSHHPGARYVVVAVVHVAVVLTFHCSQLSLSRPLAHLSQFSKLTPRISVSCPVSLCLYEEFYSYSYVSVSFVRSMHECLTFVCVYVHFCLHIFLAPILFYHISFPSNTIHVHV